MNPNTKDLSSGLDAGELLPCPFCGSATHFSAGYGRSMFSVGCQSCGALTKPHPLKAQAIAAWNRRVSPPMILPQQGWWGLYMNREKDMASREFASTSEPLTVPEASANADELLPCPFCGQQPEPWPQSHAVPAKGVWCWNCGAQGGAADAPVAEWNARAGNAGRRHVVNTFEKNLTAITEHSIRNSLATIEAALEMRFGGALRETAWLIEYPPSPDHQPRWWHPVHGWTVDPNRALRLARREDAQAVIDGGRTLQGTPTEHKWLAPDLAAAKQGPTGRSVGPGMNPESELS